MSSPRLDAEVEAPSTAGAVFRLLDVVFGFFVWTAHLLAVYIATAVACVLGLGAASAGTRATFLTALALVTVAATAVVVLHAVRRYRRDREVFDRRFPMGVTIGSDAIATVAIAWQFFPILLVPVCA